MKQSHLDIPLIPHALFVPKLGIKFVTKVTNPHTSASEQMPQRSEDQMISSELGAMVNGTCIHQSASITNTCKGPNRSLVRDTSYDMI